MGVEIWKRIKDTDYEVSSFGRVKSIDRVIETELGYRHLKGRLLTPTDNGKGYLKVFFCKNNKKYPQYVHRLVAGAFIENKDNKKYINHIDYNRNNNHVSNLEWVTAKENYHHSSDKMAVPRKCKTKSRSGYKYIYYSEKKKLFRVRPYHAEEKMFKTLEEALVYRDQELARQGVIAYDR